MAILIANIGTSDLAIQVDVNNHTYYLPIDFLADEPNLKEQIEQLSDERKEIWEYRNQQKYVSESKVYKDLGFPSGSKQTSRKLTEILSKHYQENPQQYHSRIRLTRIGGVIQKALEMEVDRAYIFVTNQVTDQKPNGEEKDTFYLFQIIEKWLKEELLDFSVEKIEITANTPANNQDLLLEYYYAKLNEIYYRERIYEKPDELVLISLKGGTPQMKVSLQIQTIASQFKNLIFLDPKLNINTLLDGQTSDCEFFSYWLYQRTQKYQTVKLLLNRRWDFHGAKVILEEWQKTLSFLKKYLQQEDAIELIKEKEKLNLVIENLENAVDYLNFASDVSYRDNLHSILNLYTQCRIYWKLEEIANFLPRLGSFYEEVIQAIIIELKGEQYCKNGNRNKKWTLLKSKLDSNSSLIKSYEEAEKKFIRDKKIWRKKITMEAKNDKSEGIISYEFILHDEHRLTGSRYRKKSFAEALISHTQDKSQIFYWQKIEKSLNKINYWVDQRNNLIHGVKGLSKNSMEEKKKSDITEYNTSSLEYKQDPYISDPNKSCQSDQIIKEMSIIFHNVTKLFSKEKSPYVDIKNPEQAPYYLYSEIKEKVIKQLDES